MVCAMRRLGGLVCLLALVLAGCRTASKEPAKGAVEENVAAKPAAPAVEPPALGPLYGGVGLAPHFFSQNAITPFHHVFSQDARLRAGMLENLRTRLKQTREAGATSVRVDLWWAAIERKKGEWSFDVADRVMAEIVAAGLEPMPILCYSPAWSPTTPPADPGMREEFAVYAEKVAARYKDTVSVWEVWNEPNTGFFWPPRANAYDYTDLLKTVYPRVKAADPDCRVAAFCTAGADADFVAACYARGAAGNFDILSYHHYGSEMDEGQMEREIESLRAVMDRNGDGAKPMIITELGLSTGRSAVVRTSTPAEQASWVVKKHLMARSLGVERLYYFKLVDDPPETNPDGLWGLLDANNTPKPSWVAYQAMVSRLAGAQFIGRAWRLPVSPMRRDDAEFHVYLGRDEEVIGVAWTRGNGSPLSLAFPASAAVKVESMDGAAVTELQPGKDGLARVELTPEPLYLRGLSREVLALASVQFVPPRVVLSPGALTQATLVARNPTAKELPVRLEPFYWNLLGRAIDAESEARVYACPPGGRIERTVTLSLPGDAPALERTVYAFNDVLRYTYRLDVTFRDAFDLSIRPTFAGPLVTLLAEAQNLPEGVLEGSFEWRTDRGILNANEPFRKESEENRRVTSKEFQPPPGEMEVSVSVKTDLGSQRSARLRIARMPLLEEPPTAGEGVIDWMRIPLMSLDARRHQVIPPRDLGRMPDQNFSAGVRMFFTEDRLYLRADVKDSSPMLAPFHDHRIHDGDCLELYLGFGGPTTATVYQADQFHLGISPGAIDQEPLVWNWTPRIGEGEFPPEDGLPVEGAEFTAIPTSDGYRLEGFIPLSEFAVTARTEMPLGLDVQLNNRTRRNRANEQVLMWNGGTSNWKDPSAWGVGLISAPEEETQDRSPVGETEGTE